MAKNSIIEHISQHKSKMGLMGGKEYRSNTPASQRRFSTVADPEGPEGFRYRDFPPGAPPEDRTPSALPDATLPSNSANQRQYFLARRFLHACVAPFRHHPHRVIDVPTAPGGNRTRRNWLNRLWPRIRGRRRGSNPGEHHQIET